MKAITARGGKLSKHEEKTLEELEREVKAIRKAREARGDQAPSFDRSRSRDGDYGDSGGVLGKRRRDRDDMSSSDEDVPEEVRKIPMPRDTPPPIPKDVLDQWYARRRARRDREAAKRDGTADKGDDKEERDKAKKEAAPDVESKTVYEAKPVVRDLRKEAVSAFVPTTVQMKMNRGQGKSGLMEPEEADRLEKEGYMKAKGDVDVSGSVETKPHTATVEDAEDEDDD